MTEWTVFVYCCYYYYDDDYFYYDDDYYYDDYDDYYDYYDYYYPVVRNTLSLPFCFPGNDWLALATF